MKKLHAIIASVCILPAVCGLAFENPAAEEKRGPILVMIEENDLLSDPFTSHHQDRHYTHGIKFVYLGGDNRAPGWVANLAERLPSPAIVPRAFNTGIVLGQNMHTPENLRSKILVTNDRPYAGWLYTGAVLQRRGATPARQIPVMENFEAHLGIIGPESLSKEAQRTVHRWRFPDDIPKGWDNQLKTEPGLVMKYGRLWRLSPNADTARHADLIPHLGVNLGNVQTFAAVGATARFGWNLPDDFGMANIDSVATVHNGHASLTPSWGFHVFGRVESRAVGRNVFLDGSTFRDSHDLAKHPFVADFSLGFLMQITRYFELGYVRILRTEEFKEQNGRDIFGSIMLKAKLAF